MERSSEKKPIFDFRDIQSRYPSKSSAISKLEPIPDMDRSSEKKPIFDFRDIQSRYPSKSSAIAKLEPIPDMERSSENKPIFDFRDIQSRYPRKSSSIAKLEPIPDISLSELRQMCDLCNDPSIVQPDGSIRCGAAMTYRNADKLVFLRHLAELPLKFYNDTMLKSFKLVKVCKVNCATGAYSGSTFRAQEDGSEDCLVFRGVVYLGKALFCEIKDDEIKLLPGDDDYVSFRACM